MTDQISTRGWRWAGLSEDELLAFERTWCAHVEHASWRDLFDSPQLPTPFGQAQIPISKFICSFKEMPLARKETRLLDKHINPLIGRQFGTGTSGVTALRKGRLDLVSSDPQQWEKLKCVMLALLLGNTLNQTESDRYQIAKRVVRFLFQEDGQLPIFFFRTLQSETWERPVEGVYHLLWFSHQPAPKSVIAVSGNVPFAQVDDSSLTDLGLMTLGLAARGGKVQFVCPDKTVGETPAYKSVQRFFDLCTNLASRRQYPKFLIQHFPQIGEAGGIESAFKNISRVFLDPEEMVDLSGEAQKLSSLKSLWAGQCLDCCTKYIYFHLGNGEDTSSNELFIARRFDLEPFVIRAAQKEQDAYLAWQATFLTKARNAETLKQYSGS